ncbi:MAG: hypothetical protein LUE96_09580 [Lachnospiraceae bacterium]|nr:hypothetical protein [Lachnospiraceae bacterium]
MSLKQIYRNYIRKTVEKKQKLRIRKQWIAEWLGILTTDAEAVRSVKLTKAEEKEIQDYWRSLYGKKIPLCWHKKYYAYSGKLDKEYFPEIFYTTRLDPLWNRDRITDVLGDKTLNELIFAKAIHESGQITVPKTLGGCANGYYFSEGRKSCTKQTLTKALGNMQRNVIIKPSVGESSGNGVRLLQLRGGGIDNLTGDTINDVMTLYGENFIIQEVVNENEELKALHPESVNTVRIMTYRINGEVHATPMTIRMGRGKDYRDNGHAGGIFVGMKDDGTLLAKAHMCGSMETFDRHPDTGIVFEGYCISYAEKIREAAFKLHECLPSVGNVNWDLAVDETGNVVLIEANVSCGSMWLFEIPHGKGVFGSDTADIIRMIAK